MNEETTTPVKYWKMQLHPGVNSEASTQFACRMLSQNCIGLDDEGLKCNMKNEQKKAEGVLAKNNHTNYLRFANAMTVGDYVLIAPHSAPLALCVVASDYIYDELAKGREGIVFRHFRFVKSLTFFADVFSRKDWPNWNLSGQGTIGQIREKNQAFALIEKWRKKRRKVYA